MLRADDGGFLDERGIGVSSDCLERGGLDGFFGAHPPSFVEFHGRPKTTNTGFKCRQRRTWVFLDVLM